MSLDRWGPNDEYPDDPDFECRNCGHCFNEDALIMVSPREYDSVCPECGSANLGGGGFYG